jgi:ABC-type microcin C transport system duplicated ATPase subunit YejF
MPVNLLQQSPKQLRYHRGNQIAMIFQEPMSSLNPVFTCGHQVKEAIQMHQQISEKEATKKPSNYSDRYNCQILNNCISVTRTSSAADKNNA